MINHLGVARITRCYIVIVALFIIIVVIILLIVLIIILIMLIILLLLIIVNTVSYEEFSRLAETRLAQNDILH